MDPRVVLAARAPLVVALLAAGIVVHAGVAADAVRALAGAGALVVVGVSVLPSLRRRDLPVIVTAWITVAGAAIAGAGLGSTGHASLAVLAVVPLTWVAAHHRMPVVGAAAAAGAGACGVVAAALCRTLVGADVIAAAVAITLAGFSAWAGSAVADEVGVADLERAELRRLRAEMVTTVSHELRTPLAVIQGATATLSRRWDVLTEPERLDLVDVLTENVASLDASIMHFADAARLERGEFVVAPDWVRLDEPLTAATSRRAVALAGHEVRADWTVQTVWADRTALERILEHLLLNAARFSAVGLPILLRSAEGAGEVTLTVSDQGQGIAPRLLATIWEPLQRGDVSETGVSRGAGLGLPIVRELARLHGGDATLSSVRGRGTTVSVTLPQPAGGPPTPGRVADHGPADEPRRGALSRRSA